MKSPRKASRCSRRRAAVFLPQLLVATAACAFFTVSIAIAGPYEFRFANPVPQGNELGGLAFQDGTTGWAVGLRGTVLRTDDAAETWTDLSDFNAFSTDLHDLVVLAPNVLLAVGAPPGIFRSEDGGLSWTAVPNPSFDVLLNIEYVADTASLSAIGHSQQVLRSDDGGLTWTLFQAGVGQELIGQHWLDGERGYVVGTGVARQTIDGGQTWQPILGVDETDPFTSIYSYVTFWDDLTGFIFGDFSTSMTTDGGLTWTEDVVLDGPIYQKKAILYSAVRRLVITETEGADIWITNDNGTTWTYLYDRQGTRGYNDVERLPSGRLVVASTFGDLLYSDDDGATWTNFTRAPSDGERVVVSVIRFLPGGRALAGSRRQQGALHPRTWLRSDDAGQTWYEPAVRPEALYVDAIEFWDAQTGVVAGKTEPRGLVYRTIDGGESWTGVELPSEQQFGMWVHDLDLADASTAYALAECSETFAVYRTDDRGLSWSRTDAELPLTMQDFFSVDFVDAQTGWVAGGKFDDAVLWKTTDGGTSWQPASEVGLAQGTVRAMWWFDAQTGLLAIDGLIETGIHRTDDGGATWTQVDDRDAQTLHFVDDQHGVSHVPYRSGQVRVTSDGGITWETVEIPWTGAVDGVTAVPGGFYVAGEGSVILHGRDETAVAAFPTDPDRISVTVLSPNPTSRGASLRYALPFQSRVRITVHDVAGRRVSTVSQGLHRAGHHIALWDGRNTAGHLVAPGIYFLHLQAGHATASAKVTVLR